MKRVPFSGLSIATVLALGATSSLAFAECKDLVLRMQDSSGKSKGREITAFFNCHGGSYDFPEATTLNFFEWKNGQLCHSHRVCGNVKYWKGHFGVGATWVWGSTLSDFTQNSNYLNHIVRLADGSPGSPGGAGGNGGTAVSVPITAQDNGKACVNKRSDRVAYIGPNNYVSNNNDTSQITDYNNTQCVDKSHFTPAQINAFCGQYGSGVGGYHPESYTGSTETGYHPPRINPSSNFRCDQDNFANKDYICFAGAGNGNGSNSNHNSQYAGALNWVKNNYNADQLVSGCNGDVDTNINSSATANGGNGGNGGNAGNGYSPVFGSDSGTQHTDGSVDTNYDETSVNVFFALDFGQIERYCSGMKEEVCF